MSDPESDITVRRAAPSEAAYETVAGWFDDEITTELFLRELAEAGFKVVPINRQAANAGSGKGLRHE